VQLSACSVLETVIFSKSSPMHTHHTCGRPSHQPSGCHDSLYPRRCCAGGGNGLE
jgi:hypothetical protein